jgi:hypothetical protein
LYKVKENLYSDVPWVELFDLEGDSLIPNPMIRGSMSITDGGQVYFTIPQEIENAIESVFDRQGYGDFNLNMFARRVLLQENREQSIPVYAIDPPDYEKELVSFYIMPTEEKMILSKLHKFGKNIHEIAKNILLMRLSEIW